MARGCIVIADVTGYTIYLSESELEHARDTLSSILQLLLEHTRTPLVLSRLEGDAVISYALETSFLQGQTVIEILETTYVSFRRALDLMVVNTSCDCNACRNIGSLDLKFFVHFGEFLTQKLTSYVELIGSDVNLAHRLAKNTITKTLGMKAYTAYTAAAAAALAVEPFFDALPGHEEGYEHLGTVELRVQDMEAVWQRERNADRIVVAPDQALVKFTLDLPVTQVAAWDYVTAPEFRALLVASESSAVELGRDGRLGRGAVYQCAHGSKPDLHTIVDWQPFEQHTFRVKGAMPGTSGLITMRLNPVRGDAGTHLTILVGKVSGGPIMRHLETALTRVMVPKVLERGSRELIAAIELRQKEREQPGGEG